MLIATILTGLLCIVLFRYVETGRFSLSAKSCHAYHESLERVEMLLRMDGPEISDESHSILLTHGHKVARAIVMYHGYTNCPRQYENLAQKFFERGYNVYVPRIPYHGNRDLYTREIGKLTVQDLMKVCDESVDIAQGLGDEITVLGLSMGGVMASWNAQVRNDVDTAVVIVPSFAWYFLPRVITPLINLALMLPNMYVWWAPIKRENRYAPHTMYYKFSTRGIGHILRLGLAVLRRAKRDATGAKRIIVITNEMDMAVDEVTVRFLSDQWRAHGTLVDYFQFSKDLKMEHDIIDPEHPYEQTDHVYQKIFELINETGDVQ